MTCHIKHDFRGSAYDAYRPVEEGEPLLVEEGEPLLVEEGEPLLVEEGEPLLVVEGQPFYQPTAPYAEPSSVEYQRLKPTAPYAEPSSAEYHRLEDFIQNSEMFARNIIDGKRSDVARSSSKASGSGFFSYFPRINVDNRRYLSPETRVTHHVTVKGDKNEEREKDDKVFRVVVGILFAAVVGIGTYFVGKLTASSEDLTDDLDELQVMKENLQVFNRSEVTRIVQLKEAIINRKQDSISQKRMLTIALVAGAALGLVGAIFAQPALLTVGIAVGIATGIGLIYRLAYDAFSQRNIKDAQRIQDKISQYRQNYIS